MNLEALRHRYTQFSYWISATFFVFVGLNLLLGIVFAFREFQYWRLEKIKRADIMAPRPGQPSYNERRTDYQMKWLDTRAYLPNELARLDRVLDDFYENEKLGYRFSPFTHYSNVPFISQTLNVATDEAGFDFRVVPNARETKDKILIFGGSTTFGTHVSDDWAFASRLQSALPTYQVFNFGRANYSWFQEMVLFQRLLHSGYRPKIAIFVDGVNVFSRDGTPVWSDKLKSMWEEAQILPEKTIYPQQIPFFRLINYLSRKRRMAAYERKIIHRAPASKELLSHAESYISTLNQLRALGKQFGIKLLFVLQPNRAVNCDHGQYSRPLEPGYVDIVRTFYESLESYRSEDFLNLVGLCEEFGKSRLAFVDDVHYSPAFNVLVAQKLAQAVRTLQ